MPDAATLKMRYPAFAAVSDGTIAYWLTDAQRFVGDWGEDTDPALMARAAHSMATTPGVLPAEGTAALPAGVTSFRSGSFSATLSEAAVSASVKGGYDASPYGIEFAGYLRRNSGGPVLIGAAEPAFVTPFALGYGWL